MNGTTVASHLARRFAELGVETGFGIVGDFALRLFGALHDEGFPVLVTGDEQGAAFAADAYARLRGFGVVAVTYGAGGLKVANATANAWAEQVPLLVLSGGPGLAERRGDAMLHHRVKDFGTQERVFAELTCAQAVLTSPHSAADEIDRVIRTMLEQQRPGYLEVPRDLAGIAIEGPHPDSPGIAPELPPCDPVALGHAVDEIVAELAAARRAAIHAGAFVARRRLQPALLDLATAAGIPVATSSLGRGVFPERHDLGLGLYLGALSPEPVVRAVEDADVILSLGVLQTDLTLGGFTASLDHERLVLASDTEVTVGYRTYREVPLHALLPALAAAVRDRGIAVEHDRVPHVPPFARDGGTLTVEAVVAALEARLDDRHGVLLDPGESLFASADMRVPAWSLGSAYYATMGYALPAALGAGRADPGRRPVAVLGDGSLAMTGLELASAAFHGVAPIVVVIDNAGYGTQRPMLDGPFNDIAPIASERLADLIGRGTGRAVSTAAELDDALADAIAKDTEPAVIRAIVPGGSRSAALARLGAALARRA